MESLEEGADEDLDVVMDLNGDKVIAPGQLNSQRKIRKFLRSTKQRTTTVLHLIENLSGSDFYITSTIEYQQLKGSPIHNA